VLNDKEHLGKSSLKEDEAKFIGYSLTSKAYRVILINSKTIIESINVSFDDSFQATSEQLNSGLKLNDVCSAKENEILYLFDELYDDDTPSVDSHRISETDASEGLTNIPLSGPLNTSPSTSHSGPQVDGECKENISSTSE